MKIPLRGVPSVLLRIPLNSVNQPLALFAADAQQTSANWLREFYQQPVHQQALYLASPALFEEVIQWLRTDKSDLPSDVALSIAKYALRSATRATPFGLFAGLSLTKVDERTDFVFSADKLRPFTRLDSSALVQLYEYLLTIPAWRHRLRFVVTNSMYRQKGQYRYSEFVENERERLVVMSSLDADDYLDQLVDFTQVYHSFDELVQFIAGIAQVNRDEAEEYIDTLIQDKFLLSELEPTVTGIPYINRLKSWFESVELTDEVQQWLQRQPVVIQELTDVQALQEVDNWLNQHEIVSANNQSFWQTNLWFNNQSATVARPVVNEIGTQISEVFPVLERTAPGWIDNFARRFKSRYQDRSLPLLQVLDNESGLGLRAAGDYLNSPAPRAEQLLSQLTPPPALAQPVSAVDSLRRDLLERTRRSNATESELRADDLPRSQAVPAGYWSVLGTLLGANSEAIDNGQYDFMLRMINANSTALAGRFCQDSDELASLVRTIHEEEAHQFTDCVLAEVVHLAGVRSGNVNIRPTLRSYEIPYLTPSSVSDEYVINLSDLLVSVSDSYEISLFSSRLNKRVIPRLTTAHNVAYGDEIYQFLSGVGQPQNASAHWSWKEFSTEPFLPRVRYKKLIVARAQWHISTNLLEKFDNTRNCWHWFRENYPVARHVTIQTGDNELVLDIDTPLGNRFILSELSKRKKITLAEWLSGPDQCWIRDAAGQPYANEALLFFQSPIDSVASAKITFKASQAASESTRLTRKFLPGSEWLYLKLYTGPETANQLLTGPIWALLTELSQQNRLQQWFFVRYLDPEFHMRLRIKCTDPATRDQTLLHTLKTCQRWVTDGFVDTFQMDTYDRELERYGEQTIDLCEDYFDVDTRMIVAFLTEHPDADEESVLLFAVANAIAMATDFGFSDVDCLTFFRLRQQGYHFEFSVSKEVKDTLNRQFRSYRQQMTAWQTLYNPSNKSDEDSLTGHLLHKRTIDTQRIINNLTQKMPVDDPGSLFSLVGSLLHMSMNRLFTSQLRLYELMVYHLTCRYYESTVARSKD